MNRRRPRWLLPCFVVSVWVVMCTGGVRGEDAPSQLDAIKEKYESHLTQLQEAYENNMATFSTEYVDSLGYVGDRLQSDGNLDGVLAVREEQERFAREESIPDSVIVSKPAPLRQVQSTYNRLFVEAHRKMCLGIVNLSEKYMKGLEHMQKEAVADDDIATAMQIRDEHDRILHGHAYKGAQAVLNPPERRIIDEAVAKDKPVVDTSSSTTNDTGAKIYKAGKGVPTTQLKKLRVYHTGQLSRSLPNQALVTLGRYEIENVQPVQQYHTQQASFKHEKGETHHIVRLDIAAATPTPLERPLLVVQYFSKDVNSSEVKSEKTEHIKLPVITQRSRVVVDTVGVTTWSEKRKYVSAYNPYRSESGRELYGLVISMFDSDGELIYQRCTRQSLAEYAQADVPPAS